MNAPTILTQFSGWVASQHIAAVAAATSLLCLAVAVAAARLWRVAGPQLAGATDVSRGQAKTRQRRVSAGTLAAIAAFIVCTSVSLNTSYRFTGDPNGLAMTDEFERVLSCAAYESLMAMCVLGARERMTGESKSPGWYGSAVWIFAALSAIPAAVEGDGLLTASTAVRIIVGSFGSALAAHSALGLDLKHRTGEDSEAPSAVILRDLRERLMSRMGLTQRNRSAQQIAQERALSRAVELRDTHQRMTPEDKTSKRGQKVAKQLAAAQDAAGLATDEAQKTLYVARVTQRQHSTSLKITDDDSPWVGTTPTAAATVEAHTRLVEHVKQFEALADEVESTLRHSTTHPLPQQRATETADVPSAETADRLTDENDADVPQPTHNGGRAAAAQGQTGPRVTARVPDPADEDRPDEDRPDEDQADEDRPDEDQERTADIFDLRRYPSKKAKLLALYEAMIKPEDRRTTNAIAEELLGILAAQGVTYDRGPANKAVAAKRRPPQAEKQRA
ncbi:hypothetical protein [Streptomyces celluloflavus]|uniref:hypothetical protein n=1 Tax=Streptomyces celluloflavus TaxID=58344 RepID=UPI0036B6D97B